MTKSTSTSRKSYSGSSWVFDLDNTLYSPDVIIDGDPGHIPYLADAIRSLPGRKIIFSNSDERHVRETLSLLGMPEFELSTSNAKPEMKYYRRLMDDFSLEDGVMVDDIAGNLSPAHDLGMTTVWVNHGKEWGRTGIDPDKIDYVVEDLPEWLNSQHC